MAVKRKLVSTRVLSSGMRIDQEIKDGTGRTLIERGVLLDDFQIEYLKTRGVGSIYVSEGQPDPDELNLQIPQYTRDLIEKSRKPDKPKAKLSESVKKQVGEGVQKLFDDPSAENFTESSANIAGQLMDSVLADDAVAIDLGMLRVSDDYTFRHSVDVSAMAIIIGKACGFSQDELREIAVAGLLHDVGKAKIPAEILNKPGRLEQNEFEYMKQHSLFGFQILKEKNMYSEGILKGVLQHHEKLNGKGYPMGVSGNQIHKYARVIAVADVFDALVNKRVYKEPFPMGEALEMVISMTRELDIDIMEKFLHSVILYPVDSIVTLSTGEMAKVVENVDGYPMRPRVVGLEHGMIYDLSNDVKYANVIVMN